MRVYRDGEVHEIRDLTVSVALSGDMEAVHVHGDNTAVLATDTQKNTVYAFAKEHGIDTPEAFAALLARHFLGAGAITRARVEVSEAPWTRLNDHAFTQSDRAHPHASVVAEGDSTWFASGIAGLVVLKTTALRVPRLPARPLHDAEGDDRPRARDRGLRALAPPRRRGLVDGARRACSTASPATTACRSSRRCTRWARRCSSACPTVARGPAVDAQQAPLRRRPLPVRAREPERGLPRRRPALRADRGRRRARRRPRSGPDLGPATP